MSEAADYYVHPTAIVDQPCTIGKGTKIWHFRHVMSGARIGERCILGQNVFVANDVAIPEGQVELPGRRLKHALEYLMRSG